MADSMGDKSSSTVFSEKFKMQFRILRQFFPEICDNRIMESAVYMYLALEVANEYADPRKPVLEANASTQTPEMPPPRPPAALATILQHHQPLSLPKGRTPGRGRPGVQAPEAGRGRGLLIGYGDGLIGPRPSSDSNSPSPPPNSSPRSDSV